MPALNSALLNAVSSTLEAPIISYEAVSGGDISDAYSLITESGRVFLKVMPKSIGEGMFEAEEKGLDLLRKSSGALCVPRILGGGSTVDQAYLAMQFLPSRPASNSSWTDLGAGLAKLHGTSSESFGLEHNNFIGSLSQRNDRLENWPEFYARMRIQPLIDMAQTSLTRDDHTAWERVRSTINNLLPACPPSLIHGDLWSGNIMHTQSSPAIFDPAVYFAHREVDIAMSRLFGGFPKEFYNAYTSQWPLDPGFEERIPLYQLYYVLVHVVLFGGHYRASAASILKQYS